MMKCSKCKKELIDNKKVKEKGSWQYVTDIACIIFGGPIATTLGVLSMGGKLYNKFIKDEVEIKCPHCKTKLTLTRAEYKELKKSIEAILDEERKSKQNRIIR